MEQTRQIKGIWIPIEVWETADLAWNEKILLMEIDSFTKQGVDCFMSDEYIGNLLGVSTRTAAGYMAKLINLGYVERTRFDGRKRFVQSRLVKICRAGMQKIAEQNCEKLQTNNISLINKQNNIERESNSATRKFSIPSPSEVQAYCDERNNGITGEEFCDFYESKGWKVGTTPMKDWKACIRTWERARANKRKTGTATPAPKKSDNYVQHAIDQMQRFASQYDATTQAEAAALLGIKL